MVVTARVTTLPASSHGGTCITDQYYRNLYYQLALAAVKVGSAPFEYTRGSQKKIQQLVPPPFRDVITNTNTEMSTTYFIHNHNHNLVCATVIYMVCLKSIGTDFFLRAGRRSLRRDWWWE